LLADGVIHKDCATPVTADAALHRNGTDAPLREQGVREAPTERPEASGTSVCGIQSPRHLPEQEKTSEQSSRASQLRCLRASGSGRAARVAFGYIWGVLA